MKKLAFITLLSISVVAIAVTSGNSQKSSAVYVNNVADTTPKMHHTMMKKTSHDSAMHKNMMKTKTKSKMAKDSTNKK